MSSSIIINIIGDNSPSFCEKGSVSSNYITEKFCDRMNMVVD